MCFRLTPYLSLPIARVLSAHRSQAKGGELYPLLLSRKRD